MTPRSLLVRLAAIVALTSALTLGQSLAQPTTYNDAIGDISPALPTAGGTLDIVKMEVTDTTTDIIFTLTVNGNISNTDWGNFMIGIANQKTAGTTTGNGWGRPINLDAGDGNGMTHWIGSWVNGGGGSQLWTYSGTSWNGPAALAGYSFAAGTESTITYTVTKASLGVATGDTILFDAYSSGGGGGDGAVDALSNPSVSITAWGGNYTSQAPTISSYTLSDSALNTTQNITFSVNMNAQIAIGAFDPDVDLVSVDWGEGFSVFEYLTDENEDGIYTGTATISAPQGTPVAYRFTIEPDDPAEPLIHETVARSFTMPSTALTIPAVFFDNIAGYRDVTFTVNMSVQETLGTFNPATQSVIISGTFNGWSTAGTNPPPLTAQGDGIYTGTFLFAGASGQTIAYKFVTIGSGDPSYESGDNRTFNLVFNADGAPAPPIDLPTVFFSNQDVVPEVRPVTFTVDMALEAAASRFNPETDNVRVTGSFNEWSTGAAYNLAREADSTTYSGTFLVAGSEGSTIDYKFYNSATDAPNSGYEPGDDRTFSLGPVVDPQVLPPAIFGVASSEVRNISFAVDMSIQQAKGLFNPETGVVQLRGLGSFDEADARPLARQDSTLVYSGTFEVPGDQGSSIAYKFWATGPEFEVIDPNDGFVNRTATLGASGTPQDLPLAYFSNELFYVTGLPFSAFTSTQGSASAAQSITIGGQGLTANIVATAPTGFEVSADGLTYGPTANITPVSGAVDSASLFVRLAASAAAGSPSGNVALTSTGSQPVNLAVAGTVTAGGQTFADWSGDQPLTPSLQLEYAIGGASGPDATDGVPSVTTVTTDTLSITAVVRTNDPTLTVNGQTLADLTVGPWTTNNVTVTVVEPQPEDLPEGCELQTFSTPRGPDAKKFLRLQTTLPAQD